MIRLFDAKNTFQIIENNGIKILHPFFAEITKEDNGDYYIEIEDLLDNSEYYQKGMILAVDTPWGVQGFRCDNPRIENNIVSCKAWHLFYDSKNYVIAEKRSQSGTCQKAIKQYYLYTDTENIFSVSSDITEEKDTEIEAMSLYDVFVYLTNVYGGHWVRNNFDFAINESIGQDRGVVLAYNKNITDMKVEESWDNVCTKIMPYTMVGDKKITLCAPPNNIDYFVDLEDIGQKNPYEIPFTKIVEFKNESGSENYTTVRAWLRGEAEKYLIANKLPKVNYSVSANIDNISDVGDVIRVKHPKCNVDIYTEVISVKYDVIRQKYTEIEFGNFRRAFKNILTETASNAIAKTSETVKGVLNDSRFGIDSLNFYTDDGNCLQLGSVLNSSEHKLRIRQKPKDSDTWGDWRFIQEEGAVAQIDVEPSTGGVVLFSGIGSSTNVKLTPPIKDNTTFKYIEIFYALSAVGYDGATSDFHHSVKVSDPYGKKISLLSSTIDASGNVIFGVGIVKINYDAENDISKIVFETNANKAYNGSNMATAMTATSSANKVYIRKVVGYKV